MPCLNGPLVQACAVDLRFCKSPGRSRPNRNETPFFHCFLLHEVLPHLQPSGADDGGDLIDGLIERVYLMMMIMVTFFLVDSDDALREKERRLRLASLSRSSLSSHA